MATIGFAQLTGKIDRLFEGFGIRHCFHVEPQRRDPLLLGKHEDRILEFKLQLVSQRHHVSDRQTASLHGEVECHVGGHQDDGHPFIHPPAALLVGPKHGAVEIVGGARSNSARSEASRPDASSSCPLELGALFARLRWKPVA